MVCARGEKECTHYEWVRSKNCVFKKNRVKIQIAINPNLINTLYRQIFRKYFEQIRNQNKNNRIWCDGVHILWSNWYNELNSWIIDLYRVRCRFVSRFLTIFCSSGILICARDALISIQHLIFYQLKFFLNLHESRHLTNIDNNNKNNNKFLQYCFSCKHFSLFFFFPIFRNARLIIYFTIALSMKKQTNNTCKLQTQIR